MQTTLLCLFLSSALQPLAPAPAQESPQGLFLTVEAGLVSQGAQQGPFRAPTDGLSIEESGADDPDLLSLMREFSHVTGQTLVLNEAVKQQLSQVPTGVLGQVQIPPDQVYSFVESLLVHNGFVITRLKDEPVPLIGVHWKRSQDYSFKHSWLDVRAADIELYRDHPALLIQTVVDVSPMDARGVANSLRALVWDTNFQAVVPTGTQSSLLLRGTGSEVASWVRMLERGRVFEREDLARRTKEQAEQAALQQAALEKARQAEAQSQGADQDD